MPVVVVVFAVVVVFVVVVVDVVVVIFIYCNKSESMTTKLKHLL